MFIHQQHDPIKLYIGAEACLVSSTTLLNTHDIGVAITESKLQF